MKRPLLLLACAAAASLAASLLLVPREGHPPRASAGSGTTILAAGDIASCSSTGDEATGALVNTLPGEILILGDLAYQDGTAAEFATCYDPSWGPYKARSHPAPGNHEYHTVGAAGYYAYFGAAAGDPTKGYYSFDLDTWHIIALNSNCAAVGGCNAGSPQELWLRNDLATHPAQCTLAYFHHARFSSGVLHGSNAAMQPFWQALYDYGADVVLVGHVHNYERFAPQTPAGAADGPYGIRQFVVGTGGRSHYAFATPLANSEVRDDTAFGVLQMSLDVNSYTWDFTPASGYTFTDSGSDACHRAALDPDADGRLDAEDNCPADPNPGQENADANFVSNAPFYLVDDATWVNSDSDGDLCDLDDDNDGLTDLAEAAGCGAFAPTNPLLRDTDGDRFLDGPECTLGADPGSTVSTPALAACGPASDADTDRLSDRVEVCFLNSNPGIVDTDGDATTNGAKDGCEAGSINTDRVVNSGDQLLLAQEFVRVLGGGTPLPNMDVNKDGNINSGDQLFMAFLIVPPGQCP